MLVSQTHIGEEASQPRLAVASATTRAWPDETLSHTSTNWWSCSRLDVCGAARRPRPWGHGATTTNTFLPACRNRTSCTAAPLCVTAGADGQSLIRRDNRCGLRCWALR